MIGAEELRGPAADEGDESHHHDQRARCGFAEGEAVDHLHRCDPLVVFDCGLIDVGQYRIGAAKGQQRRLGEKPAHLRQRTLPAEHRDDQCHAGAPQR